MSERETALNRIRRYVGMRLEKPIMGLGEVVHAIHTGTPWEAEVLLSDLALAAQPVDAPQPCVWRDIATAPKDGSWVLLAWYGDQKPHIGFWNGREWEKDGEGLPLGGAELWMPLMPVPAAQETTP